VNSLSGQTLGNCLVQELLGAGGMGQVYKGLQVSLNRPVAIKVMLEHLTSDPKFVARFRVEAQAASALKHPNIIGVYDFNRQGDMLYLVMEYMDGGTLGQLQSQYPAQPLPLSVGLDLIRQAAEGLAAAQSVGMIHRDIKPDNLLLSRSAGSGEGKAQRTLKLTDFGLARLAEGSNLTTTNAGRLMGTVHYFSPEQCRGENLDGRSDLYSLGVVFYQVVTGRKPFAITSSIDAVYKHAHEIPPAPRLLRPDLPLAVEEIVLRCLAKSPEDRYQTGMELSLAIQHVQSSLSRSHSDAGSVFQPPSISEEESTFLSERNRTMWPQDQAKSLFPDLMRSRNYPPVGSVSDAPPTLQLLLEQSAITPLPPSQSVADSTISRVFPNHLPVGSVPDAPSTPQLQLEQSAITPLPPSPPTVSARKSRGFRLLSIIGGIVVVLILAALLFATGILPTSYGSLAASQGGTTTGLSFSTTQAGQTPTSAATSSTNKSHGGVVAVSTPTAPSTSTPGAKPTSTPTQVTPSTPTPSNSAAYYKWATSGSPTYYSSMAQADNFGWYLFAQSGKGYCSYTNNAFEEDIVNSNAIVHCYERTSEFTNLTFQAQIAIQTGDGGGLLFRSNPDDNINHSPEYRFYIYTDGSYALTTPSGTLSSGSAGLSIGLNKTVTLTAIAYGTTITLYLNERQLVTLQDSNASTGIVGLFGADVSQQTTVDFTNVSIWQLS
jgi:serine/threonine protein kinase